MSRRKRTVSRRQVVVSSSEEEEGEPSHQFSGGYDYRFFVSEEAYRSYLLFSSKKIFSGSEVHFGHLGEFDLLPCFEFQGWVSLLTSTRPVYSNLVRIFYANLTTSSHNISSLTSKIHGRSFTFTSEMLGDILGVAASGADIYDKSLSSFDYPLGITKHDASMLLTNNPNLYNDLYSRTLSNRARVLANLLSHTIVPKTGSRDRMSPWHRLLTYCILAYLHVNLPLLIMKAMYGISSVTNTNLYYGAIITRILEYFDFALEEETEIGKQDQDFGIRNINLMRSGGALPPEQPVAPPSPPPYQAPPPFQVPPPVPPVQTQVPPFDFSQFESRLFSRLDQYHESSSNAINQLQDQFTTWQLDVQQQEQNLQSHLQEIQEESDRHYRESNARLDYHMNYLYDQWHFPPPPPFHFDPAPAHDDDDDDGTQT